jgi:hypothetical protein
MTSEVLGCFQTGFGSPRESSDVLGSVPRQAEVIRGSRRSSDVLGTCWRWHGQKVRSVGLRTVE